MKGAASVRFDLMGSGVPAFDRWAMTACGSVIPTAHLTEDQGDIFACPGFRRTIVIEPQDGLVRAGVEDDLHAMFVELHYLGAPQGTGEITKVRAVMDRHPWSVCTGAQAALVETFTGLRLDEVSIKRARQTNCTHLHDLAILAAAHAQDVQDSRYTLAVSDPVDGVRHLEVRYCESSHACDEDGARSVVLHHWIERDGVLTYPEALEGQGLMTLRAWIAGLEGQVQEAARLLQWVGLMSHSRTMNAQQKHAALFYQPSCFTMQKERVEYAQAASAERDFSTGPLPLVDGLTPRFSAYMGQRHAVPHP